MVVTVKQSILGNSFYELRWFPYKNSKIELFITALTKEQVLKDYENNQTRIGRISVGHGGRL